MVAQISLSVCASPMSTGRVAPVDWSPKEGGRPPEPMPLQEPFQEGCSWATWGTIVYIGYAGSAVAYFGVRGAYTLSLGALQWCAQWAKSQPCTGAGTGNSRLAFCQCKLSRKQDLNLHSSWRQLAVVVQWSARWTALQHLHTDALKVHIGNKVVKVRRSQCHLVLVMQVLWNACRYAYAFLAFELLSAVSVLLYGLAIVRRAPRVAAPRSELWKKETEDAGGSFHVQVAPAACTQLISRLCSLSQLLLKAYSMLRALCCLVCGLHQPAADKRCNLAHTKGQGPSLLPNTVVVAARAVAFSSCQLVQKRRSAFLREPALY